MIEQPDGAARLVQYVVKLAADGRQRCAIGLCTGVQRLVKRRPLGNFRDAGGIDSHRFLDSGIGEGQGEPVERTAADCEDGEVKQRLLAGDIEIERPGGNACRPRHVGRLGALDAHVGETGHRRLGDVVQSILGLASHLSPFAPLPQKAGRCQFRQAACICHLFLLYE